jgi:pimeloyl-ACP methyl ester carboxylesterase
MLNHSRSGSGEPLLLIHGIGSFWQAFEPVLEPLAAEREVIAIDLPGFGGSAALPPGTVPTVAALTDAVSEFIDSLGLETAHVAGNSLGGLLALELAKRGRARSVVALSPAGFWTRAEAVYARTVLQVLSAASLALAPAASALLSPPLVRRALFSMFFGHPERLPPEQAAAMVRNLAASRSAFVATLGPLCATTFSDGSAITVPVTIAWGERDRLLLPRQAARAAAALAGSRAVTLRDCGHVPMFDDPEQVARAILS